MLGNKSDKELNLILKKRSPRDGLLKLSRIFKAEVAYKFDIKVSKYLQFMMKAPSLSLIEANSDDSGFLY